MNLTQLQARLARYLGLANVTDDPDVAAWTAIALNDAQLSIATELQIPRDVRTVTIPPGPYSLGPGVQSWGLLAAADTTNGNPLGVVSTARRVAEFPSLPPASVPRIVAYEPSTNTIELLPPPIAPVTVVLYLALIPADMVNPTDEPWNGQYADWHDLVAMRAALLVQEADWADPNRVAWVKKRYDEKLASFMRRINEHKDIAPQSEVRLDELAGT